MVADWSVPTARPAGVAFSISLASQRAMMLWSTVAEGDTMMLPSISS
jgi:hypothetical protein